MNYADKESRRMTKKTIGTIMVLASLSIVLLAQNGLPPDKLQKANSEKAFSLASDVSFSLFARDRATAAQSEKAPRLTENRWWSGEQPRLSMAELSYAQQSSDVGFSTGADRKSYHALGKFGQNLSRAPASDQ
jgi:hypothetical protein